MLVSAGTCRVMVDTFRPLQFRAPNPPPAFVGRRDELRALKALFKQGPLAVVWGLGGLGKTALALQALHKHFPRHISRAVLIGLRPHDSALELAAEIARALAA